jgi:hypothetical protein
MRSSKSYAAVGILSRLASSGEPPAPLPEGGCAQPPVGIETLPQPPSPVRWQGSSGKARATAAAFPSPSPVWRPVGVIPSLAMVHFGRSWPSAAG